MSTGYFSHPQCRLHEMGAAHPERPERLDALEDRLRASGLADLLLHREAPRASLTHIELAHERLHVAALQGLGTRLEQEQLAGGPEYLTLDPDTALNRHTFAAALHAAGAALAATDAVMAGEMDNAFCAVRPPGHHATRSRAMGFCFFNNVAIAAKYALDRHALERVAIIDFDVHHGNGTEDICAGDDRILMCSIFQHPFYPFSGEPAAADNMLNVPVAAYTRGMDIREIVEMLWVPRLEAFRPQMLFISAGFDSHREDDMGQLNMTEHDFAWITLRMMDVARRFCRGRIVSCLEGGYALDALGRSVEAHVRALAEL